MAFRVRLRGCTLHLSHIRCMGCSYGEQDSTCAKAMIQGIGVAWDRICDPILHSTWEHVTNNFVMHFYVNTLTSPRSTPLSFLNPPMPVSKKDTHKLFKQALLSRRYLSEDLAAILWQKCELACKSNGAILSQAPADYG